MKQLSFVAYEIVQWQRETFRHQGVPETAHHLKEEAVELERNPYDEEEMADVFFLLLAVADRAGVDLAQAAAAKLEENRRRKWELQPDGSHRHVKDAHGA